MLMTSLFSLLSLVVAPALADDAPPADADAPVVAQDEEGSDDDADPAEDDDEESVASEKADVKKGAAASDTLLQDDEKGKKRVIKTIQKKNFMKLHRFEVGPSVGFVANDPFLNRYIIGGTFDYHLTEVFALSAQLGYAPILGQGGEGDPDWKPLSKQLLLKNSVSPDISKLTFNGSFGLAYSPIYGKAAVGRRIIAFDIYGHFGLGVVSTSDDLVALQAVGDEEAIATQNQMHPTTVIGGGARVAFSQLVAARVEGKSLSYVETVNSTTLEMKNNFILQGSCSFFFPNMK